MRVTLVVPTLNEIDGMKQVMPRVKKDWYDQLIILDGGSTDGTIEYARKLGYFVHIQKKNNNASFISKSLLKVFLLNYYSRG